MKRTGEPAFRSSLHYHATSVAADHLGHLLYVAGWSPADVAAASPAIAEILTEVYRVAYGQALKSSLQAMNGGCWSLVAVAWCLPYLAAVQQVASALGRDSDDDSC